MNSALLLSLTLLGVYYGAAADLGHGAQHTTNLATSATSRALKTLAAGMNKQDVPGLKSGSWSRRQLTQGSPSECVWKDDACSLNEDKAMEMMEGSSSPLSKFFKAIFKCGEKTSYESCIADKWCHWVIDECSANDNYLEDESVAHCLGKSRIFLEIPERQEACSTVDSDGLNGCEKDIDGCRLNENEECEFDFWLYTIGVPSGRYGLEGFSKATVHQAQFWTNALVGDLPFLLSKDASRYLKWTPPKADCPAGVAQIVCDYAAPLGKTFAMSLFCQNQYEGDSSGCAEDSRCENEGNKCAPSAAVVAEVEKDQIQVLGDYSADDALTPEILLPFISCPGKVEADCGGECEWDYWSNQCSPNQTWVLQRLAEITGSSSEPRCKLLTAVFASGCPGSSNPECTANPKCSWNLAAGECEASTSEVISVLTSVAPDVRSVVSKQVECDTHEEDTCL